MANTKWRMKGQYIKNCNCSATCPCDTIGFPGPNKFCETVLGMHIREGNFDGADLSGLKWMVAARWPGALHEGNGTAEVFIDEKANDKQREALGTILTGQAGGTLFEIFASILTKVVGPHFTNIEWQFDKDRRRARVAVAGFFETTSEPLTAQPSGEEQRVIVKMPGGFEYKEMEVAYSKTLKSTGAIKFDWKDTHSSLADVEHTQDGLVA